MRVGYLAEGHCSRVLGVTGKPSVTLISICGAGIWLSNWAAEDLDVQHRLLSGSIIVLCELCHKICKYLQVIPLFLFLFFPLLSCLPSATITCNMQSLFARTYLALCNISSLFQRWIKAEWLTNEFAAACCSSITALKQMPSYSKKPCSKPLNINLLLWISWMLLRRHYI